MEGQPHPQSRRRRPLTKWHIVYAIAGVIALIELIILASRIFSGHAPPAGKTIRRGALSREDAAPRSAPPPALPGRPAKEATGIDLQRGSDRGSDKAIGTSAEIGALEKEVRALTDRGEYQKALDHLDAALARRGGLDWAQAVGRLTREVREAIKGNYIRLKPKAESARNVGATAEVAKLRDEVVQWGVREYIEDFDRAVGGVAPSATSVSDGLVGWWKLDEVSGMEAADASGRGHAGTWIGQPMWRPTGGRIGGAVELEGKDSSIRIPRHPDFESTAMTFLAWAKLKSPYKNYSNIFRKTWGNNKGPIWSSYSLQYSPSKNNSVEFVFVTGYDKGSHVLRSPPCTEPDQTWIHVACRYDPAGPAPQKRLYIDGQQVASATLTQPIAYDTTPTGDLHIGQNGGSQEWYAGWVDDVRVYKRALTEVEIRAIRDAAPAPKSVTDIAPLGSQAPPWPTPPADDLERQWRAAVEAIAPGWKVTQYDMASIRKYANDPARAMPVADPIQGFCTHPPARGAPCLISRTVNLPAGKKSTLCMHVGHHPGKDFILIVKVSGKELLRGIVGGAISKNNWVKEAVDLVEFAGQTVTIEIHNHPNDWDFEHAFWRKIAIE